MTRGSSRPGWRLANGLAGADRRSSCRGHALVNNEALRRGAVGACSCSPRSDVRPVCAHGSPGRGALCPRPSAIGLSLTWGMLRIINLAHFGLILLSGYLTYTLATNQGIDPLLHVVHRSDIFGHAHGVPALGVSELNSLLVRSGLLVVGIHLISNTWSAELPAPDGRRQPIRHRSGHDEPLASRSPLWSRRSPPWRSFSPWTRSSAPWAAGLR